VDSAIAGMNDVEVKDPTKMALGPNEEEMLESGEESLEPEYDGPDLDEMLPEMMEIRGLVDMWQGLKSKLISFCKALWPSQKRTPERMCHVSQCIGEEILPFNLSSCKAL